MTCGKSYDRIKSNLQPQNKMNNEKRLEVIRKIKNAARKDSRKTIKAYALMLSLEQDINAQKFAAKLLG